MTEDRAVPELDEDVEEVDAGVAENPQLWTSDAALSFDEARRITSRRGATLVMLVGEVDAGKTTILVELWTDLMLHGSLGALSFAGSTTALAFEERSFGSRLASGRKETLRTNPEDDGLLHLGVSRFEGDRTELLLADVTGEHFRSIREGIPFDDEFPWLSRVDRFVVLIDGSFLSAAGVAEVAFTRTSRQLLALKQSAARSRRAKIALVLSKDDAIEDAARTAFLDREERLLAMAREIDPDAQLLRVAARPETDDEPRGLSELLDWIAQPSPPPAARAAILPRSTRAFGRLHG